MQQAANAASFALLGQSFQYGPYLTAGFKTLSAICAWPVTAAANITLLAAPTDTLLFGGDLVCVRACVRVCAVRVCVSVCVRRAAVWVRVCWGLCPVGVRAVCDPGGRRCGVCVCLACVCVCVYVVVPAGAVDAGPGWLLCVKVFQTGVAFFELCPSAHAWGGGRTSSSRTYLL